MLSLVPSRREFYSPFLISFFFHFKDLVSDLSFLLYIFSLLSSLRSTKVLPNHFSSYPIPFFFSFSLFLAYIEIPISFYNSVSQVEEDTRSIDFYESLLRSPISNYFARFRDKCDSFIIIKLRAIHNVTVIFI